MFSLAASADDTLASPTPSNNVMTALMVNTLVSQHGE